ncbi:hypothetical protein DITRI_Ditri14bG0102400 [Diplodiscus trichospermus]
MDNNSWRGVEKGVLSVIQGDEMFFNRIISKNPSVGCSSRIYYYRNSEGIPFNWEMQPGTPKEPHKEDNILPPISPPPAVLSLGLPKPCIKIEEPKPSMKLRFKFWKQGKKKHGNKKLEYQARSRGNNLDVIESDKYSNYEMCSSDDGEFMGSSRFSRSSSSSLFSFSNGFSFRSSRLPSPSRQDSLLRRHYGCSPLNFFSVLVRVSRSRRL